MVKIIWRIALSLFMVIIFWFVFNIADTEVRNRYIEKHVKPDLEHAEPTYDNFFYTTVPSYNHHTPLYAYEDETFRIRFYEIVVVHDLEDIREFVYILIHHKGSFDVDQGYGLQIEGEEIKLLFPQGIIYEILLAVNDNDEVYMHKDTIIELMDKPWELINRNDEVLLTFEPSIQRPFEIKQSLLAYVDAHDDFPQEQLEAQGIYHFELPDYSPYYNIYFIAITIYALILLLTLYFLFVRRSKKTGKSIL